jgi:hypothetical protein
MKTVELPTETFLGKLQVSTRIETWEIIEVKKGIAKIRLGEAIENVKYSQIKKYIK